MKKNGVHSRTMTLWGSGKITGNAYVFVVNRAKLVYSKIYLNVYFREGFPGSNIARENIVKVKSIVIDRTYCSGGDKVNDITHIVYLIFESIFGMFAEVTWSFFGKVGKSIKYW